MKRTGVFICHCGVNIAGTVDVKKVVEELAKEPGVAHSEDYVYMCSDPGQNLIEQAIKEKKLDNIVVACCSTRRRSGIPRKGRDSTPSPARSPTFASNAVGFTKIKLKRRRKPSKLQKAPSREPRRTKRWSH
jgi:hypothetical protein